MDSNKDAIVRALLANVHIMGGISRSPEHAMRLAEICAAWAELDHILVLAYAGILQTPYEIAKHALHNSTNINARAKMVRSACEEFPPSQEYLTELRVTLTIIAKLSPRRAAFVHGRWASRMDGAMFLLDPAAPDGSQPSQRRVSASEMAALRDAIIEVAAKLTVLVDQTRPLPSLPESIAERNPHIRERNRRFEAQLGSGPVKSLARPVVV